MIRYERRVKYLAAALSGLAGFVDAVGFLNLGGYFVSFMSGNTTRMAVGVAQGSEPALIAGGLIGTFVAGVMLGTFTGHMAGRHRATAVLILVAVLLAMAAGFGASGHFALAAMAMALAMGAENAIFANGSEVYIGLTYMTGTLVKMGQNMAGALLGGPPFAWWPYFLLWLGLAAGAVAGAAAYPHLGLNSLWIASVAALIFALLSRRLDLRPVTPAIS
ncbi:MAG: YoaK family protein [Parvibaculaceae bacterium]